MRLVSGLHAEAGGGRVNLARITRTGLLWLSLLGLAGCFSPPPTQQALMAQFHAERSGYEALRKMMQEDGITDILHYGGEFEKDERWNFKSAEKIDLSHTRAGAYRSLMKKIDVPRAFRSEHDEAALLLDSWGMANRGWRVLVVWRATPPRPLLDSLDDFQRSKIPNDWQEGYAHAEGDWYFKIIW
ncbi:hypothetical protein [Lysobacter sp. CA199]|uniref:hypothetical protein n=1 Tax=Lysobacter sp. CA199 TaxID=3455608 RepID=UPI003F8D0153